MEAQLDNATIEAAGDAQRDAGEFGGRMAEAAVGGRRGGISRRLAFTGQDGRALVRLIANMQPPENVRRLMGLCEARAGTGFRGGLGALRILPPTAPADGLDGGLTARRKLTAGPAQSRGCARGT